MYQGNISLRKCNNWFRDLWIEYFHLYILDKRILKLRLLYPATITLKFRKVNTGNSQFG